MCIYRPGLSVCGSIFMKLQVPKAFNKEQLMSAILRGFDELSEFHCRHLHCLAGAFWRIVCTDKPGKNHPCIYLFICMFICLFILATDSLFTFDTKALEQKQPVCTSYFPLGHMLPVQTAHVCVCVCTPCAWLSGSQAGSQASRCHCIKQAQRMPASLPPLA